MEVKSKSFISSPFLVPSLFFSHLNQNFPISFPLLSVSIKRFMGVSASHRRRHRNNHPHLRILSISAASAVILLLIAFLSFFAPSPVHTEHLRHFLFKNGSACDGAGTSVFRVPTGGGRLDHDIWRSNLSRFYYGCSNATKPFSEEGAISHSNRYLLIATSGGLNQQRTGITDAVVAARILNATLVVPTLDQKSFWKDASNFSDIFDVERFISHLSKDVKIIKALPGIASKIWTPYTMRVPRKCNARCYESRVLPKFLKKHVVRLTKFDYRLSNRLDTDLQKLRCRVNYHALKFADPIVEMGEKLVHRMRLRSNHYIALHLRFEPDMLAFSGCYYGGGDKEIKELGAIRRRWKTLRIKNPDKGRRQGRCPLTPEEVGLMLRALGYDKNTHIYVASGEIYGGEETLAPLKALFPNFYSKDTLASKEELDPFSTFSSRMAALDFIVCDESDVFVTNNNGNMAKILAGRRRYYGHKLTIRPNAKKLYRLFGSRFNTTWEEFAADVQFHQKGFMGEPMEVKPGRGVFHENPASCICEDSEAKEKAELGPTKVGKASDTKAKSVGEIVDYYQNDNDNEEEDESELSEEDQNAAPQSKTSDEPELEEFLSD